MTSSFLVSSVNLGRTAKSLLYSPGKYWVENIYIFLCSCSLAGDQPSEVCFCFPKSWYLVWAQVGTKVSLSLDNHMYPRSHESALPVVCVFTPMIKICGFQKVQWYHSKQFYIWCSFNAIKKRTSRQMLSALPCLERPWWMLTLPLWLPGIVNLNVLGAGGPSSYLTFRSRVPKSQNWCQMCVNIKNPLWTSLFPQSPPCSPDINARRTLRHQGQPLLTRPAAGHLWDLQASFSELENVHTHRWAHLMYCVSHWSRKFWALWPALF